VVSCDYNALAYVCGDLLIELDKCAECGQHRGSDIPECVASCEHAREKAVLEPPDIQAKQERAATALSLQKL
jgi:ferredoxin